MKVVQINTVCDTGSTGKICVGISNVLNMNGIENYILYSYGKSDYPCGIKCSETMPKIQALRSRLLGNYGFNSRKTTIRLIEELERISPEIVHLHNLHGHNCNLELLMEYIKKNKIKLIWTFHDCWAFTAYCPYFEIVRCEKWKEGCHHCVQARRYSWFIDRSQWMYNQKKNIFSCLDMTIVTPSQWLANLVKDSFLKEYPIRVINNGIDLNNFKPSSSELRQKYQISENKFILLGVAAQWVARKGADVFVRLSKRLDSEKMQIILVGTDDRIDQQLPEEVISIHRTSNQKELAEIYTMADVFVNPTREENYPTVNMEALACGTPVITFNTGGSPEIIDEKTGIVVECDDEDALYAAIVSLSQNGYLHREDCLKRALMFDANARFEEYVDLYRGIIK